jgi:hypothetical protein
MRYCLKIATEAQRSLRRKESGSRRGAESAEIKGYSEDTLNNCRVSLFSSVKNKKAAGIQQKNTDSIIMIPIFYSEKTGMTKNVPGRVRQNFIFPL